MGGVNHQPCGRNIACSTRLSKAVSLAYAKFMEANATLEDALLGEIKDDASAETFAIWERSQTEFHECVTLLHVVRGALTASIDDMEAHPFLHDEILRTMDLGELKSSLVSAGAVVEGDPAYDEATAIIRQRGFEGLFREYKARFDGHIKAAEALICSFDECRRFAREGTLMRMIEQNELPFRLHFARLMNPLTRTIQLFSYSSLVSVEIHYRSSHCRPGTSLLNPMTATTV
ncbi:MAG: hypothetical protein WA001_02545 [Patescibacteria group bacterium]